MEALPQEKITTDNLMSHMKQSEDSVMNYTPIHRLADLVQVSSTIEFSVSCILLLGIERTAKCFLAVQYQAHFKPGFSC